MFSNEFKLDSDPTSKLDSNKKKQNEKPEHFYTDKEIESLISTDFCLNIDQVLRKAKDDFVEKVKDNLVEYLTSKTHVQNSEPDYISAPSITQETSNNYFSHQEEEQQFIEEEQQFIEEEEQIIEEEEQVSINSNKLQVDNVSSHDEEEENQYKSNDQSDKIPSGIFNSFVDDEEEERSKFEFEDFSQIQQNLPQDELSQIEKVKHYGSVASESQIGGEEELHSVNFLSTNNEDDINLSPIGDNKSGDKSQDDVNSASHISGGNGFDDFGSDELLDEFAN